MYNTFPDPFSGKRAVVLSSSRSVVEPRYSRAFSS
jgi:hypothetical protein